jgi:hypothetical protein
MPYDIINMIFKHNTFKDAVCIGLTCPKLYGYLKAYHEAPIPLTISSACSAPSTLHCHHKNNFSGTIILAQIVAHWKTFSTYRFVGAPIFMVDNREGVSRFITTWFHNEPSWSKHYMIFIWTTTARFKED